MIKPKEEKPKKRSYRDRLSQMKNCFVLLERLDKKILTQYMQEKELSSTVGVSYENTRKNGSKLEDEKAYSLESHLKSRCKKARKSIQGLASRGDNKRRKRKSKAKLLYYTDDEEDFALANPKKVLPKSNQVKTKSVVVKEDSSASPERLQNSRCSSFETEVNQERTLENLEESPKPDRVRDKNKKPKLKEKNDGSVAKDKIENPLHSALIHPLECEQFSQKDRKKVNEKINFNLNKLCKSAVECKEEKKKDCPKPRDFQESKKGIISKGPEGECSSVLREKSEDGENDPRDEDEDDRETIIFERSSGNNGDKFEVLETAKKASRSVNRKFKEKKMMNRKKQKLIKFKRKKSMLGRNLAKVKKLRKKLAEACDSDPEPSVAKGCSKEVGALIKRLHELYTIILQLQTDLPKSPEQAGHFIRTINIQKENFHKEISKSHKILLKGYENMLNSYRDANKVPWEIEKRTCLNKENTGNVISGCSVAEGASEEKKRPKGTEEQRSEPSFSEISPKCKGSLDDSKKLQKRINDKLETMSVGGNSEASEAQSFQGGKTVNAGPTSTSKQNDVGDGSPMALPPPLGSSGSRPAKPFERPASEPKLSGDITSRENACIVNSPSEHFLRTVVHHSSAYQGEWVGMSKPSSCVWTQRGSGVIKDPRVNLPQDSTRTISRAVEVNHERPFRMHNQCSNGRNEYRRDGAGSNQFPIQNAGHGIVNGYSFGSNTCPFQVPGGFVTPAPCFSGRSVKLPFPMPSLMNINLHTSGYNHERVPVNPYQQIFNSGSSVAIPSEPQIRNVDNCNSLTPSGPVKTNKTSLTQGSNISRRRDDCHKNFGRTGSRQAVPRMECPMGIALTGFVGSSESHGLNRLEPPKQVQFLTGHPLTSEEIPRTVCANESEKCTSYVLDPTVPQKLTLRNYRFEAGPVLEAKGESSAPKANEITSRWHQPVSEASLKDANECVTLYERRSCSRTYVCAQNGCKNTGVRICKGCLSIIYCSETCQLKHWTLKHKTECHQLKELRG